MSGIITQGRGPDNKPDENSAHRDQWMTTFEVMYGNGSNLQPIKDENNKTVVMDYTIICK